MPIHTITWEDPHIELIALSEVIRTHPHPTILCLAISGDTALQLLSSEPNIKEITCVSENSKQLAIIELKAKLITSILDINERLNFLNGRLTDEQAYRIYQVFRTSLFSQNYWDEHFHMMKNGIFRIDPWSQIFTELKKNHFNYRNTFTHRRMRKLLGESETSNALSRSYYSHFEYVIKKQVEQVTNPVQNYFYHKMIFGEFLPSRQPDYLTSQNCPIEKLRYIQQYLPNYLISTKRTFDLITVGHLPDRLNLTQLDMFFSVLQKKINRRGRLILRSLNNDHPVRNILKQYFNILEFDRDLTDRTYLYSEIILASPKQL